MNVNLYGLVVLFGFAVLYNLLIGELQTHRLGGFMALWVGIGFAIILAVQMVAHWGQSCTVAKWTLLTLVHAAAAGGPMAWGSWRRRKAF